MVHEVGERPARPAVVWPWSAFAAWALGWLMLVAAVAAGSPVAVALLVAWSPSLLLAWRVRGPWRRAIALAGLPLAVAVQTWAAHLPAWAWLASAALLLALYPLSTWRDAPWYPTPRDALLALAPRLPLAPDARILDAGSGLGHGLLALRRAFPQAHLDGVERSAILAWCSRARRMPGVRVLRQDLWGLSWAGYDMVYFFQRPESMGSAWLKACREQRPGSWLVSLEFPVPGPAPALRIEAGPASRRSVYAYRVPGPAAGLAQPDPSGADIAEVTGSAPSAVLVKNPELLLSSC